MRDADDETPRPGRHKASLDDDQGDAETREAARKPVPFWQELTLLLVIALLLASGIKALFVQAFYIPSGSMNDTLVFNDRILVQKVSYWGDAEPERGDVVVFSDPGGWLDESEAPAPDNIVSRGLETVGLFPTGKADDGSVNRAITEFVLNGIGPHSDLGVYRSR